MWNYEIDCVQWPNEAPLQGYSSLVKPFWQWSIDTLSCTFIDVEQNKIHKNDWYSFRIQNVCDINTDHTFNLHIFHFISEKQSSDI